MFILYIYNTCHYNKIYLLTYLLTYLLSGDQTFCKGHQRTAKVDASRERVKNAVPENLKCILLAILINVCIYSFILSTDQVHRMSCCGLPNYFRGVIG